MSDYWHTVMFITTIIGLFGSIPATVAVFFMAGDEDARWLFALPIPVAVGILSLAWGLVCGG